MKRLIAGLLTVFSVAVFAGLVLSNSSHALMVPLSTETLTAKSAIVVRGTVFDVNSLWDTTGKTIVTRVTIEVTDVVRGNAQPGLLDAEYEGGEIGGIGLKVSDTPNFEKGQDVILFLNPIKSMLGGDGYGIVGSAQGMYRVDPDGVARKGGFTTATPGAAPNSQVAPMQAQPGVMDNEIPVETLIQKIRGVK